MIEEGLTGEEQEALGRLSQTIAICQICAAQGYFAESRPLDRGQAQARVMLIGQAPGLSEGHRKIAFGGPAGRTLMGWFASIGIPEDEVRRRFYISAITKCYPGRVPNGGGDRNPTPAERTNCRPYLLREIELIKPRHIVLIGSTAIKEVYGGSIRLDQLIGHVRSSTLGEFYGRLAVRISLIERGTIANPDQPLEVYHLPHPSGASLWLNEPQNRALLQQSLAHLRAGLSPTAYE